MTDEIDPVNMESKSDTSAQSPILDREVSNVESLVIIFDQRYLVWKVAAKASWKQLEQYCTEDTLRNILSTNEDGRLEVIQAFYALRQTSVPQQETRRRADTCVAAANAMTEYVNRRLDGEEVNAAEVRHLQYLWRIERGSVLRSALSGSRRTVTSLGSGASRLKAAAELAAKEAKLKTLHAKEQKEAEIEALRRDLARLEAEREVEEARAVLKVYDAEGRDIDVADVDSVLEEGEPCSDKLDPTQVVPAQVSPAKDSTLASYGPDNTAALVKAFAESMTLNRLPAAEPAVFTGDLLSYTDWKSSFVALIEGKCASPIERMHYLRRYIGGGVRQVLDSCFLLNTESAYADAWSALDRRYGDAFSVGQAYREKLFSWPKIGSTDSEGIRRLADFLLSCKAAMSVVPGLQSLDSCHENQRIISRLPDWMVSRWNRLVFTAVKESNVYPPFSRFVNFVVEEAQVACNPISSLYAVKGLSRSLSESVRPAVNSKREEGRGKVHVLATKGVPDSGLVTDRPSCLFCHKVGHSVVSCFAFASKNAEEKKKFVRDNRLCFGCLKIGHISKECRSRQTCDKCQRPHPTCLHFDGATVKTVHEGAKDRARASTEEAAQMEVQPAVSLRVSGGGVTNTSTVVPVWVSTLDRPDDEKLVYALLDTQSDTTFVSQDISDLLQAKSEPVRLKLTTMTSRDIMVPCQRVTGLSVRGFSSTMRIGLPAAYTRHYIPLDRSHIPTNETAKRWAHLKSIVDELPPLKNCDVGLLIGYDCAQALAPRQVITGEEQEPYAQKTDLGWSIVGCSKPSNDLDYVSGYSHRVAVKQIHTVTPADAVRLLESDFSDSTQDDKRTSQDDLLLLKKLEGGIQQDEEGYYEMPLPFKSRPQLPDNKRLAIIRLGHLKRKMDRDEKYHHHYSKFMSEVIENGEAEKVVSEPAFGSSWYIPHHGVYSNQKPDKIRVVFDCSARYGGTCLNEHLLTGPDLTNGLAGVLLRFRQHPVALMCDIQRMFHRFRVHPDDRDFLRFLWWEHGDTRQEPTEYRMKVHLFGAASSPGCANYGLRHLARQHEAEFPRASRFIERNFYVDDGVISVESTAAANSLVKEVEELCARGNLHLHKFISNDRSVIDNIPPLKRVVNMRGPDMSFDELPIERALGIHWCRVGSVQLSDHIEGPTTNSPWHIVDGRFRVRPFGIRRSIRA